MRTRAALRAAAVACVVAIGLVWWPATAGAEGEAEVGWWYRLSGGVPEGTSSSSSAAAGSRAAAQAPPPTLPPAPAPFPTVPLPDDPPGAPAPVPPAASVPEGGLYIANDTLGPLAIGAVRFGVGQVGESRLTLQLAEGGASAGPLSIVACPLLEGFQAVVNGSWRDRPAHDCARAQALGTVGTDGSMSFVLSDRFQQGGQETLDVVLLPEPTNGTPFSVTFAPVAPDALAVVGAAPDRPAPAPAPSFTPNAGAPEASTAGAPTGARPGSSGSTARPAPGASAAVPGVDVPAATPAAPATAGPVQPVLDVFDDRPWARWVASVILGALAIALAAASTGRLPAFAGAGAGTATKGVGRFARHREGPPPALT